MVALATHVRTGVHSVLPGAEENPTSAVHPTHELGFSAMSPRNPAPHSQIRSAVGVPSVLVTALVTHACQETHGVLLSPSASYMPALHTVHAVAPSATFVSLPAAHSTQGVLLSPSSSYVPALQAVHVMLPWYAAVTSLSAAHVYGCTADDA